MIDSQSNFQVGECQKFSVTIVEIANAAPKELNFIIKILNIWER